MQIPMLQVILLLSVAVLGSSIIVPLRIANETDYFYPNGTLDAASVRHHIRYVQCHFQQSDIAKSVCRFDTPLRKRAVESIGLFSAYHAATPFGELSIGGQAFNVIFDTIVPVTIVDPRAYFPEDSPTAQRIGQARSSLVPIMGMSLVSRWRDVTSVGGTATYTTFDRAEQRMVIPAQPNAMGICAMSRYHPSSGGPYTLIEMLFRDRIIGQPVFAISLGRLEQTAPTIAHRGTLSVGSRRSRVRFVPLEQHPRYDRLWAISGQLNGITSRMILASGSPFIVLPAALARYVFGRLGLVIEEYGSTLIAKYVCAAHPPLFRITFPTTSVTLSSDSVLYGAVEAGFCISSIIGEEQDDITLGLPFFRSAYVSFDLNGLAGGSVSPGRIGIGRP
ncbi:hypothetical protein V8E36_001294 [Tilletia maclaganii]